MGYLPMRLILDVRKFKVNLSLLIANLPQVAFMMKNTLYSALNIAYLAMVNQLTLNILLRSILRI